MVIWWRMLLVVARRADNLAKPPNAEVTTQDATRRGPPWTPVSALTVAGRAAAAPRRTTAPRPSAGALTRTTGRPTARRTARTGGPRPRR